MTDREQLFEITRSDMSNIGITDDEILKQIGFLTDEEVKEALEIE